MRAKEVIKLLTGFRGYGARVRPDFLRDPALLAEAQNVWLGGRNGIAERRGGMSLIYTMDDGPAVSLLAVPFAYGRYTYTQLVGQATTSAVYVSAPQAALSASNYWTKFSSFALGAFAEYGVLSHGAVLNGKLAATMTAPYAMERVPLINLSVAGFQIPAAPTAANAGSGAYAATVRYYRVQWVDYESTTRRKSAVGPSLTFTPSGSGASVTVTRPTAPGTGETHWVLWGSADNTTFYRLSRIAIATTTYSDSTAPGSYSGVTGDEMTDSMTVLRFVGMGEPPVPSAADQGSGTYAATLRYYRVRYIEKANSTILRRSEPSTAVSITPSGSGASVRVTRGDVLTEGETHWELEVSLDDANWYLLTTVLIATTTYDDSAATSTYSSGTLSEDIGERLPPPNVRTVCADRDRWLFGGGWYEHLSRIWYTPVIGTTAIADEERVPLDNYVDVDRYDDDELTFLAGPVGEAVIAFKRRSFYRLIRTGIEDAPYEVVKVSDSLGAEDAASVCVAPDGMGGEAVYFANSLGAWRYSVSRGIERLSTDLDSSWSGYGSGNMRRVVYYPIRQVVLFGQFAYHIETGGWSLMQYPSATFTALGYDPAYYLQAAVMRDQTKTYGGLVLPARNDGDVWLVDDVNSVVDANDAAFTARVRTNRVTLAQLGLKWYPTRLRFWGTSTQPLLVNQYSTPLETDDSPPVDASYVTLSDQHGNRAVTGAGVNEFLSLSLEDIAGRTPSAWRLDAIEIAGMAQEPLP